MASSPLSREPVIIDIRESKGAEAPLVALRTQVIVGLSKPSGQRTLPIEILYDERGLQLLDELTTNTKTYLAFKAEKEILQKHSEDIVKAMGVGTGEATVFELGAGSLEKTAYLLQALADATSPERQPPVSYYALDMEKRELIRTLNTVESTIGQRLEGRVNMKGVCGTFDRGLAFIREGRLSTSYSGSDYPPLHFLFLGTTIGNFPHPEAAAFLRSLPLRSGKGDTILIGMDNRTDGETMKQRYNDPEGYASRFSLNGLRVVERALRMQQSRSDPSRRERIFAADGWVFLGRWDEMEGCHEGCYRSTRDQVVEIPSGPGNASALTVQFQKDEIITYELSHKFSDPEAFVLFAAGNLRLIKRWTDELESYSLWLLERTSSL